MGLTVFTGRIKTIPFNIFGNKAFNLNHFQVHSDSENPNGFQVSWSFRAHDRQHGGKNDLLRGVRTFEFCK